MFILRLAEYFLLLISATAVRRTVAQGLGACLRRSAVTFGVNYEYPKVVQSRPSSLEIGQPPIKDTRWTLRTRPTTVYRPRSQAHIQHARLRSLHHSESEEVEWEAMDVAGPDIEDRNTLVQLARMAGNAYRLPDMKNWYDVDPNWNTVRISSH